MNEMKFNSQICTSREQSEKLLALGLKKETADMCYKVATHDWRGHEIPEKDRHYSLCSWYDELNVVCGFEQVKTIPAWSLHRLIEMRLDEDYSCGFNLNQGEDPFEKVIRHIEHHIKEGYFNKEYLV